MESDKETLLKKKYQILTDDDNWLVAFYPFNDAVTIFIENKTEAQGCFLNC